MHLLLDAINTQKHDIPIANDDLRQEEARINSFSDEESDQREAPHRQGFQRREFDFGGFEGLDGAFDSPIYYQPNVPWQQYPGFYQPFGQGYGGGMATPIQFSPAFSPHTQSWQPWWQQTHPAGILFFTNSFGTPTATFPGYVSGISGSQSARGAGDFWPTGGAGPAGAGQATVFNQGCSKMPQQGTPSEQNGEPVGASSTEGKGEGGGKEDGSSAGKDEEGGESGKGEGAVTEQPKAVVATATGWFDAPSALELPDGIPKGLEVGSTSDIFGVMISLIGPVYLHRKTMTEYMFKANNC